MAGVWSQSLFGCFDDIQGCCLGTFCTPCLLAHAQSKVLPEKNVYLYGVVGTLAEFFGCCGCFTCIVRKDMGDKLNIATDDGCAGCCSGTFCGPCQTCQAFTEVKKPADGAQKAVSM